MSKADEYRQRAAECQRQAEAARIPGARKTLLEIAKKYLKLADNEERHEAFSPGATGGKGKPPPDARG